jgi:phosphoribosyl 1,2-cyclic phosphodiesterase
MKYGGNTSCIQMNLGDRTVILDAGTGIRLLGKALLSEDVRDVQLLLTHTHWDHINGFPFFVPAYDPKRTMHITAGHLKDKGGIQSALSSQMDHPMFPIPIETMQAAIDFVDFQAGDEFTLFPDVRVKTAPLNHPNGATAYRIEYKGKSAVYVTDTEHVPGKPDKNVLALIEGADLVIYDSTYTDEEFPEKVGWGHSTWQEGIRLCRSANVGRLVIFHHDPEHDDVFMENLEAEAKETWADTVVARESMEITLD